MISICAEYLVPNRSECIALVPVCLTPHRHNDTPRQRNNDTQAAEYTVTGGVATRTLAAALPLPPPSGALARRCRAASLGTLLQVHHQVVVVEVVYRGGGHHQL